MCPTLIGWPTELADDGMEPIGSINSGDSLVQQFLPSRLYLPPRRRHRPRVGDHRPVAADRDARFARLRVGQPEDCSPAPKSIVKKGRHQRVLWPPLHFSCRRPSSSLPIGRIHHPFCPSCLISLTRIHQLIIEQPPLAPSVSLLDCESTYYLSSSASKRRPLTLGLEFCAPPIGQNVSPPSLSL